MKNIKLEICTYNIESCLAAQRGGADRVELCAGMAEGGITPSYSMIEYAKNNLFIDIMVMIRPRVSDFLYSDYEFEIMKKDIEICKRIGVKGVVFGILNSDGSIDKQRNKILLDIADNMETCFHRAIDMSSNYVQAAKDIANMGFTRILSSGAKNKATDGLQNLKDISLIVGDKIEIMAGSGINPNNIKAVYDFAKPSAFHFSAKKIMQGKMLFRNPDVSMGGVGSVSEYDLICSDEKEILRAREVINSL